MKNTIKFLFFITVNTVFSQQAITDTGTNVGIGVTSPTQKLDVNGNIQLSQSGLIGFKDASSNFMPFIKRASDNYLQVGDIDDWFFGIKFTLWNSEEKMRIDGNGNVGIGTTAPLGKLHVVGETYLEQGKINFKTVNPDSGGTTGIMANPNGWTRLDPNGSRFLMPVTNSDVNSKRNILDIENKEDSWKHLMELRADGSAFFSGNVGIGTANPFQKLHVNGNIGIGLMAGTYIEGFRIDYVDGGSGTTTFKNNRWGGDIYFKRNSSQGERTQFLFGGASEHYLNIYNSNNEVKVRFVSGGTSYIDGGNLGIGTTDTKGFKLGVQGKIAAEEVKVAMYSNWADFVFENSYNLPTLKEVEQHIKDKGHLKDIPSASEVKENGIFLGEMDSKLLQKIEELTLYTIEQQKEIEILKKENSKFQLLSKRLEDIEKLLGDKK